MGLKAGQTPGKVEFANQTNPEAADLDRERRVDPGQLASDPSGLVLAAW